MDFGLSEEQEMLQETLRAFAQTECPTTRLRAFFDEGTGHDPALWSALAEMGVAGLIVSEEYGGAGLELLDLAVAAEVLGESAIPGPFLGHSLAAFGIGLAGDDTQRRALLPPLASGERIATIALQEDENVWAPEQWTIKADAGCITGTKTIVMHADLADGYVVGLQGGDLAWVEAGAHGISIEAQNGIDRTRPFATLRFEATPAMVLSGGRDRARLLGAAASVLLAADAFGAASRLIDMDVAYSLSREQFGQPIAQFQAIKHTIARLGTELEPSRGLWWHAAYAVDHQPDEAVRAASLAKAHLCDRAMRVARESVELHGGYGFTWECEVQMWFKRIMFDRSFLGTPDRHRELCAELAGWS